MIDALIFDTVRTPRGKGKRAGSSSLRWTRKRSTWAPPPTSFSWCSRRRRHVRKAWQTFRWRRFGNKWDTRSRRRCLWRPAPVPVARARTRPHPMGAERGILLQTDILVRCGKACGTSSEDWGPVWPRWLASWLARRLGFSGSLLRWRAKARA